LHSLVETGHGEITVIGNVAGGRSGRAHELLNQRRISPNALT
jgi:hypothetical protein